MKLKLFSIFLVLAVLFVGAIFAYEKSEAFDNGIAVENVGEVVQFDIQKNGDGPSDIFIFTIAKLEFFYSSAVNVAIDYRRLLRLENHLNILNARNYNLIAIDYKTVYCSADYYMIY